VKSALSAVATQLARLYLTPFSRSERIVRPRRIALHVISKKKLRDFWEQHADAQVPLDNWFRVAKKAAWQSIAEVKAIFPHADAAYTCTVFNIGGNKYRLIVEIRYDRQVIYVKHVLTHKEYDQDAWKKACGG
jgi:mRNA interferase HigB